MSNAFRGKQQVTAAACALAALLFVGVASAAPQQPPAHGAGMPDWSEPADGPAAERRVEMMTNRMLADINATAEQRARVTAAFKSAATELAPLRQQQRQMRQQTMKLLAAPTLDKTQLETLRAEQTQLTDKVSRRMLQAMIEAAEALSPEQRTKLAERWQQRAQHRHSKGERSPGAK